jgi:hypothetical protein
MGRHVTQSVKVTQEKLNRRQDLEVRTNQMQNTSALMTRLTKCALGEITMTSAQIAASRIFLDKTLPNLQATAIVEDGEFDNLTREELLGRVQGVFENNPELVQISGLDSAVDRANTVVSITKDDSITDVD